MSHIPNTNTVPASTGGCTSATATTAGSASDEVAPAGPTDPDIPRLTLTLTESMDVRDDDKDVCSPMHVDQYDYDGQQETEAAVHAVERKTGFEVLDYRRYPERAEDEEEEELCSELGNEQDDEDDHETDKAEEDDDEREGGGDDEEEDRASQFAVEIEASFISRTKPACSKTTLVSCLSARSVSPGPGPISPLLSEDDYMNAHGTSASASSSDFYTPPTSATPSLLSCNSASSSRRSSSGAHTPRVRFKRGCVITAVNLTWAAATYDRAPIDVAESLDIKRCQTIADCTESDVIPAEAFEEPCGAPVLHFQECEDGLNEVDDYVPDADDVLATLEQMRQQQQLGRSLCGGDSSTDEDDERLYRMSRYETHPSDDEGENYDLHPCGSFKDEGLPRSSSFSTAYLSGSNEFDVTPLGSYSGRSSTFTAAPPSPPLQSSPCTAAHVHYAYASTFGAGSPSRAAAEGLESLTVPALSPDESSTGSGSESDDCGGVWRLPTNVGPASATRARQYIPSTASSLSSATADTSLGLAAAELCAQVREEERYPGRLRGRSPTPQSQTSSGESSRRVTPSHEVSPPPQEEQPVRKQPRRGLCGMGKWSRDDVFDSCDALGGF